MTQEIAMIVLLTRELRQLVLAHRHDHPAPIAGCQFCTHGTVAIGLSDINDGFGVTVTKAVQALYDRAYPIDYPGIM